MAFKLPFISKKTVVDKVTVLPQFRYEDLEEIGIVGRGSFGAVVKCKHFGYVSTVVVKKLVEEGTEEEREFVKEARLLHNLHH